MVCREILIERITQRVLATKKVRIPTDSEHKTEKDVVIQTVVGIFNVIEEINNTPEFTTMFYGRSMEQFIIAEEWKDFFIPESVRLDPTDLKTRDLLVKTNTPVESYNVNLYVNWMDLQLKFRSFYKDDLGSRTTTLAVVRQPKSFFDILPICTVLPANWLPADEDGEVLTVRSIDDPFIPVQINDDIKCLFRSDYWNTSVERVSLDYCAKFMM